MPKKSKWGENPKAVEAKQKKEAKKIEEEVRKQKALEDEYWRDDDKYVKRKEDRKADKDKKKQEAAQKKAEKRALLEEEEGKLGVKKVQPERVTRSQIEAHQEKERKRLEEEIKRKELEEKKITEQFDLEENPNQLLRKQAMDGELQARSVTEAVELLTVSGSKKAAKMMTYSEFETRELPRLKSANPQMKHSQVKQLVWKEWQKSPDNPVNAPMNIKHQ